VAVEELIEAVEPMDCSGIVGGEASQVSSPPWGRRSRCSGVLIFWRDLCLLLTAG
jgi:hypothetical protein